MSAGWSFRRLLRVRPRRETVNREIDDELRFHLEMRVEALVREGAAPADARAIATTEFGDVGLARSELRRIDLGLVRRARWRGWLDAAAQNATYAFRTMRRAPGFAATVIGTLAIGIGANAAMFGIVDRLLLRPAPLIGEADGLRFVYHRVTFDVMGAFTNSSQGYPDYLDVARLHDVFERAAAAYPTSLPRGRGADADQVRALLTTASYFPILETRPFLGRFYAEDEDRPPAGTPVVVLSYGYWQRAFGGERGVIGRTVDLQGRPFTIIGVASRGFRGTGTADVDVFVPISAAASRAITSDWATTYDWQWLRVVVRLKPGVTETQAETRATMVYRAAHAKNKAERNGTAVLGSIIPGRAPDDRAAASSRLALLLMATSLVLLVVATANIANLLVTRASQRRREIAVRLAVGISGSRLLGQLLTESIVLALCGGAAALFIAGAGGTVLRHMLLPTFSPGDRVVDLRVFLVATTVSLTCGLLCGLAPALHAMRRDVAGVLRGGMRGELHRRSRLRRSLLIVQGSLSVTLLAGAAMFVASLRNVLHVDLGYDAQHVLLADMNLDAVGKKPPEQIAFFRAARERIAALPEVARASIAVTAPFFSSWATKLRIAGLDSLVRVQDGGPYINAVGPEYFATMGMHIQRGRGFDSTDVRGAPPVAVINETMARVEYPGRDPIGTCLFIEGNDIRCITVVGVVHDFRRQSVQDVSSAQYFVLEPQEVWKGPESRVVMVQPRGDIPIAQRAVRKAMQGIESGLPYARVEPLQTLVEPQVRPWRLGASLFVIFGVTALVLAAVGLYSVVSYDTLQRTPELGVRVALGARMEQILTLVVGDGLRSGLLGVLTGLALTLALGPILAPLLFHVSPRDPLLLAVASGSLLAVALVASFVPAWRAAHVDPTVALRDE
jgi:putative ABC transport system permease protein